MDKLTAAANKAGRKVTGARDKASDTVLMAQSRTQHILDKVQSGIDDLALGAGGGKRKTSLSVASFCAASDETSLLELDHNPPQRPLTPQYLQVSSHFSAAHMLPTLTATIFNSAVMHA